RAVLERVTALGDDARDALLAAAVEEEGDLAIVTRALATLGASPEALGEAEAVGLVSLDGGTLRFSQAVVRSALLRAAAPAGGRQVQGALAEVLEAAGESERAAWHRAAATVAPDEAVAAALEESARQSAARLGHAAAERAYARAAALTPEPEGRARRLCAAAG